MEGMIYFWLEINGHFPSLGGIYIYIAVIAVCLLGFLSNLCFSQQFVVQCIKAVVLNWE